MSNTSLPIQTINRSFISKFIEVETPCFALGIVEASGHHHGLLALRPGEDIRLLPTSLRDSRFLMAYSHPYSRNPMTWRPS
jgi:hypothetical protein